MTGELMVGKSLQGTSIMTDVRPHARRSMGQNFLVHKGICDTIVRLSGLSKEDTVIELGSGLGALTRALAPMVKKVIGIELDRRLIGYLEAHGWVGPNVEIRNEDMLCVSYKALSDETGARLKLIGNLPYNISSQILFRLIEEREAIDFAILMFQKEVADRLLSGPGSKDYGILSVIASYCADISRLMNIPPGFFRPAPKVVSTVVRLAFRPPHREALDFVLFMSLVKAGFGQRRKKLSNALKGLSFIDEGLILKGLRGCGINPSLRAEALSVDDFVRLSNWLYEASNANLK
ncbi:MAG: 16S rRNA (adenine(1518)-N(6)/adenine(1519)-N(6))-dimethyltransferase RsmA [Dissulfurimicrobium sp.]